MAAAPLKIAYLLEDTGIAGGTRVVVAQADALIELGHRVVLITRGGPLTWRTSRAEWRYVDDLATVDGSEFDFVVGTFWTTLSATMAVAGQQGVHLCQGYEGSFTAYQPLKPQIDAAYALPLPKITVAPHLVEICRRFNADSSYIGQIVDDVFFQQPPFRDTAMRVLVVGPAQADFKGIDIAYDAVRRARATGARFDLIRASQGPPADDEPADLAAEFHVAISSPEMVRLIASADVVVNMSRQEEGFGLPAAEAMAGGVAAVLSEIPSYLSFDAQHDYALFAPENDAVTAGEQLLRLLRDSTLRRRVAARGREVVEQFRAVNTGRRLEEWFRGRGRASSE